MKQYPLVFTFKDLVAGRGFIAGVRMAGRALLSEEDDGVWVFGVNPGAIAAGPELNPQSGMTAFRQQWKFTLQEIASSTLSFDGFEQEVCRFFNQEDADAALWAAAVVEVRRAGVEVDWVRRGSADTDLMVEVIDLTAQLGPEVNANPLDDTVELAACA